MHPEVVEFIHTSHQHNDELSKQVGNRRLQSAVGSPVGFMTACDITADKTSKC